MDPNRKFEELLQNNIIRNTVIQETKSKSQRVSNLIKEVAKDIQLISSIQTIVDQEKTWIQK